MKNYKPLDELFPELTEKQKPVQQVKVAEEVLRARKPVAWSEPRSVKPRFFPTEVARKIAAAAAGGTY